MPPRGDAEESYTLSCKVLCHTVAFLSKVKEMIAHHIHDALAQVRTLQQFILDRNMFKGYSGRARVLSGALALTGAAILGSGVVRPTPWAHLSVWGAVLAAGIAANYAALFGWFLFDGQVRRNPLMLRPALDALPALAAGAVLTIALIVHQQFDFLFGVWMSLYGLAQTAYRHSLPKGIHAVGLLYLGCGAWNLLSPDVSFLNPWPMGIVFFAGELAGGLILIREDRRGRTAAQED
jgi:hypothetical protein